MNTEGEFQFSNGEMINAQLQEDRLAQVSRHEAQHAELYTTTTFGQFVMMLEKNAFANEKCRWMYAELLQYMRRMQERIAVNIESLDVFLREGKEHYEKNIENLKLRNSQYYNYFRKLCCMNGRVHSAEDARSMTAWLRLLGAAALNVNLDLLPLETFNNARELHVFFSEEQNARSFAPNKRFDILVNVIFRNNHKYTDLEDMVQGGFSLEQCTGEFVHACSLRAFERVIGASIFRERLMRRADTVGRGNIYYHCNHVEYLMNLPLELDSTRMLQFQECGVSAFFDIINQEEHTDYPVFLEHPMGGFEEIRMFSFYDENRQTTYYTTVIGNEDYCTEIIRSIRNDLVFVQTKLFRSMKNRIRGLAYKLPIFIITENAVIHSLEFVSKNFKRGYYAVNRREGFHILYIWRRDYYFIAFINPLAAGELEPFFKSLDITYREYEDVPVDRKKLDCISRICQERILLAKNFCDNVQGRA
ncbi:MAG: hypothetical protein NC081_01465 [Roseburia sp.]|nr:hypothetical protein [Roseburia sp.]